MKGNLLLIDDECELSQSMKELLEDEAREIFIANNGQEAIELLSKNNDFSLILMDGQMPVMDGYEASQLIRSGNLGGVNNNIPIIALTAHVMAGEEEKCYQAGMNGYLTKPLDRAALNLILEKFLK